MMLAPRALTLLRAFTLVAVAAIALPANAVPGGGGGNSPGQQKFMPSGGIVMFGGAAPPAGWLVCDGSEVSRDDHADLFLAIGTAYGPGDGSTTFNLPDLRQRFPLGQAPSGTGSVLAEAGGQIDHAHGVSGASASAGDHAHGVTATAAAAGDHAHAVSGSTASVADHQHGVSGSTNPAGTHNHVVLIRAAGVDGGLLAGDGQRVLNANIGGTTMNQIVPGPLNAQDGILGVKGSTGQNFGSSQVPDHAHSFGTTSGAAGSHAHGFTASSASAGSHAHAVTASSAAASAHAHAFNTTSDASNPPYLVVQFIIKD